MPVDPEISLGAPVPQAGGGNPLGMLGGMLDVQNKLNQQRLFQQTFMAKQKMGEMIATTPPTADGQPDWDSIQQKFLRDPDVAPFAPQAMNEIRQLHLTNTQIAGAEQEQNLKGFGALQKALVLAYKDPSQLGTAVSSVMAAQPKDVQERMLPAVRALVTGLTANLPKDPQAARATLQSRIVANQVAQGVSPDALSSLTGKQGTQDIGGSIVSGTFAPPQEGGGFRPSSALSKSLAPQVLDVPQPDGSSRKVLLGGGLGAGAGASTGSGAGSSAPLGLTLGQGPSLASAEMMKGGADQFTNHYLPQLASNADASRKMMRVLDWAEDAMKHFTPGGGAELKAGLASAMQGLGFSQEQVDKVANGSLAGEQDFRKAVSQAVSSFATANTPHNSLLSVEGLKLADKGFVGPDYDPRAIAKVFAQVRQTAQQTFDEQNSALDYYKKGGDPNLWPAEWQRQATAKGYVNTNTALTVANPQDYDSLGALQDAHRKGLITSEAARKVAVQKGWASSGGK